MGTTGGGLTGRQRRVGDRQRSDHAGLGVAGDAAVQLVGAHVERAQAERGVLAAVEHRRLGARFADDEVVLLTAVVGDQQRHVARCRFEVTFDLELRQGDTERRRFGCTVAAGSAAVVLVAQQTDQTDDDHGRHQCDQHAGHGNEHQSTTALVATLVGCGRGRGFFQNGHARLQSRDDVLRSLAALSPRP